ncbi:methyl-accepting chemotaxis protein [Aliagarivorans marinus]|uniref:methyl-accepting chemotaxis protein n=1 Tax=Aliagarivorans marinus TaxID=561965 RepID=UPI00040E0C93|nr:methyl-accepting chemotaxis protein [Aliagarivorans marinus]
MSAQANHSADKFVYYILLAHFPVVGLLIPIGYGSFGFALIMSLVITIIASLAYFNYRGTRIASCCNAMLLMLYSAVMIQAQLGASEMHFHIFVALAFLLIYKDWMPIVAAAGFIAVHHLLFTGLQLGGASMGEVPLVIYNDGCSWGKAMLHAAFVVVESAVLISYAVMMKKDSDVSDAVIAAVGRVAEHKDLDVQLTHHQQHPTVLAFNQMMATFNSLLVTLKRATGEFHQAFGQVSEQSQETHQVVEAQMQQSELVASAAVELSQSAQNVSANADSAAQSAATVEETVQHGADLVADSVNATHALNQLLNDSEAQVTRLDDNVQEINSVIEVIQSISEQTNLLALNAAIEAARAGELGRGFAVVADEVRALAARTQQSTGEVRTIIENLQSNTRQVVSSMQTGRNHSNESTEKIEAGGNALGTISANVQEMRDVNTLIASSTLEQTDACGQIEQSIEEISMQSKNLLTQSDLVSSAIDKLQATLNDIDTLVSQYQTKQ